MLYPLDKCTTILRWHVMSEKKRKRILVMNTAKVRRSFVVMGSEARHTQGTYTQFDHSYFTRTTHKIIAIIRLEHSHIYIAFTVLTARGCVFEDVHATSAVNVHIWVC